MNRNIQFKLQSNGKIFTAIEKRAVLIRSSLEGVAVADGLSKFYLLDEAQTPLNKRDKNTFASSITGEVFTVVF